MKINSENRNEYIEYIELLKIKLMFSKRKSTIKKVLKDIKKYRKVVSDYDNTIQKSNNRN
jgi:hypothetical protein